MGPCPAHDSKRSKREIPERAAFWLQLYRDVKRWGALPDPGGLLDQETRTMRMLNVIADEYDRWTIEQQRLREERLKIQQTLGHSGGRVYGF